MITQKLIQQLKTDKEVIDRIIGKYVCSITRGDNGELIERTYGKDNEKLGYITQNIILKGHPRYEKLNLKLKEIE